jgi:hypothetical protein
MVRASEFEGKERDWFVVVFAEQCNRIPARWVWLGFESRSNFKRQWFGGG